MEQGDLDRRVELRRASISKQVDVFFNKFKAHVNFQADDEIVVLKSHLLVEYYLNQLLVLFVEDGYQKTEKFDFAQKVEEISKLTDALKQYHFQPNVLASIRALNKLRNMVGHELEFKLNETQVDAIGFPFGETYMIDKINAGEFNPKMELVNLIGRILVEINRPICIKVSVKSIELEREKEIVAQSKTQQG